jgi:hypothetical protein
MAFTIFWLSFAISFFLLGHAPNGSLPFRMNPIAKRPGRPLSAK